MTLDVYRGRKTTTQHNTTQQQQQQQQQQPLSRTYFHSSIGVRAVEFLLYVTILTMKHYGFTCSTKWRTSLTRIRLLIELSNASLHCLPRPSVAIPIINGYCCPPKFGYFPVTVIRMMLKQFIFRSHFQRLIHRLTLIHVDFKCQNKIDGRSD